MALEVRVHDRIDISLQHRLLIGVLSITTTVLKGRYPQQYYAFVRQREASSRYDCTERAFGNSIPFCWGPQRSSSHPHPSPLADAAGGR
jgi:hypothetical protein